MTPEQAGNRRKPPLNPDRRCEHCGEPLPSHSRSDRRFRSSSCRAAQWNIDNPRLDYAREAPPVRLHWHCGAFDLLTGDYRAGYWYGPEGCPPECPSLGPRHTSSQPVRAGRERAGMP